MIVSFNFFSNINHIFLFIISVANRMLRSILVILLSIILFYFGSIFKYLMWEKIQYNKKPVFLVYVIIWINKTQKILDFLFKKSKKSEF